MLPAIVGTLCYGLLHSSYNVYNLVFHHAGVAFVLQIASFSLFTLYSVPYLIRKFYKLDLWNLLHIERVTWIMILFWAFLLSFLFVDGKDWFIGNISITKSGLGEFSYGSLVLAPVFEEFFFRGVLFSLSLRVFSQKLSSVINGILFAIWHFGIVLTYGFAIEVPFLILSTGIFGYFLACYQTTHKKLGISIILHAFATIFIASTGFLIPK